MTSVMKVEMARSTYVKPRNPLGRKDVQLTTFDLQLMSIKYIQFLMVYRNVSDFDVVQEKLKDGLRVVLEDYFPLAGKMVMGEDGILRLEYDDDMDGAEWKTAYAKDVYVDDMKKGNSVHRYKEFFPYSGVSNAEGLNRPLLSVQLTKLKDGFALGCALNHVVVDGISTWHFFMAWAENCSGLKNISVKPFHDRTKARNKCVKMDIPSTSNDERVPSTLPIAQRVFGFSGSTVLKIVSNANKYQTNGKRFSTFQCVAAHVWQAVTRARQLNPEDITTVIVVANSRTRIDPPVPESYFGNIITVAHTSTTSDVLFTSPPGTPTSMIRKAIEMHDSTDIDRATKEWERNTPTFNPMAHGNNPVWFASSPKLKFYELDFSWGAPAKVWCGVNNRTDGVVFFHQGNNGDGSIDVDVNLEENAMQRLEMDKEFLMLD